MSDITPQAVFGATMAMAYDEDRLVARVVEALAARAPAPKKNILAQANDALRGYRTVIVAVLFAVLPPIAEYLDQMDWQTLGVSPVAGVAIGAVAIALRAISSGPIGEKSASQDKQSST